MSGSWLDIEGPRGARREALADGLTRIGGVGCDIRLDPAGEGELQVWNRPPRMLYLGRGARPTSGGKAFDELALRPGERVQWAGHVLVYGGEVAPSDEAALEELPLAAPVVDPSSARFSARVRAGLALDLGLVDAPVAKRWRENVLGERFDADACARELLPGALAPEVEQRLLERSGTLLRDFLMAALLDGSAGARRRAREKARGLAAFLITQGLALVVFTLLVLAALLLVRAKGTSLDALLDRFLPG